MNNMSPIPTINIKNFNNNNSTRTNKLEEEFVKEITNSFVKDRGLSMPNKKSSIENQNKYKNIPSARRTELKRIGFTKSRAIIKNKISQRLNRSPM